MVADEQVRRGLIERCRGLMDAYGDDAVMVTTRPVAVAYNLWSICSDPEQWDIPLGGELRLELVEMRCRDSLKKLRQAI